jgi:hypothetical protein
MSQTCSSAGFRREKLVQCKATTVGAHHHKEGCHEGHSARRIPPHRSKSCQIHPSRNMQGHHRSTLIPGLRHMGARAGRSQRNQRLCRSLEEADGASIQHHIVLDPPRLQKKIHWLLRSSFFVCKAAHLAAEASWSLERAGARMKQTLV